MNKEFRYPAKILLAFGESLKDNKEIHNWLLKNGYPELAALSNSINGSTKAFDWLLKNYPHLAALDHAIDGFEAPIPWLLKHGFKFYVIFARACQNKADALRYLQKNDLQIYLHLVAIIQKCLELKEPDYHKKRFS